MQNCYYIRDYMAETETVMDIMWTFPLGGKIDSNVTD
jgi:hypothetical protein